MGREQNKKLNALKRMLKNRYGIAYETYTQMYENQKGRCGICKSHLSLGGYSGLYVDHNHITGKVRGLLCPCCNSALGKFKESETIMQNAIDYLNSHK